MGMFKDILTPGSPLKALPLFHNCTAYEFNSIVGTSMLRTELCDVFKEDLLYCFYGKPSYRKRADYATSSSSHFPVCFILNPDVALRPYKLYPFDSGAVSQIPEVKKKYFHPSMERDNFVLDNDIEFAKSVVEYFYATNENYCDGRPTRATGSIPKTFPEAEAYCSMISETSATSFDDRLASIEFIFNKEIHLTPKSLLTVIIPYAYFEEPAIKKVIQDDWKIEKPLCYFTARGNPFEYYGVVYNESRKFLKENGYL